MAPACAVAADHYSPCGSAYIAALFLPRRRDGWPMVNSRNKGAAFERRIAKELFDLSGITFARDLEQYRQTNRGDLIADDPDWPFVVECKCYASGGFQQAWWDQAYNAALTTHQHPCVVWKINNKPILCRVRVRSIVEMTSRGQWSASDELTADITLAGLCYVAREGMA